MNTRLASECKPAGFTLVEVLVALAILSILSVMSFRGVTGLIEVEAKLSASASRLRAIERLLAGFENDVSFAMPRQARNSRGEFEPAFLARPDRLQANGYRVSLSHFSLLPDTTPYRVSYLFAPPRVELLMQSRLDAEVGSGDAPVTVLEGLKSFAVRFQGADERWLDTWPPAGQPATVLPRAVELALDIDGLGSVTRLIARP